MAMAKKMIFPPPPGGEMIQVTRRHICPLKISAGSRLNMDMILGLNICRIYPST